MKKFTLPLIGLALSYPCFYFARHHGFVAHIPFGLLAIGSWFLIVTTLGKKLESSSMYDLISKAFIFISIFLAIFTHEVFDRITYGSQDAQSEKLKASNTIAVGKISNIEHFDGFTIKRKNIPERWEIKYEFNDMNNKTYSGTINSKELPVYHVGDTLSIRYVKDDPEINELLTK